MQHLFFAQAGAAYHGRFFRKGQARLAALLASCPCARNRRSSLYALFVRWGYRRNGLRGAAAMNVSLGWPGLAGTLACEAGLRFTPAAWAPPVFSLAGFVCCALTFWDSAQESALALLELGYLFLCWTQGFSVLLCFFILAVFENWRASAAF